MNLKKWLVSILRIVLDEKGQIPLDGNEPNEETVDDTSTDSPVADGTETPGVGQDGAIQDNLPVQTEETFLQAQNLDPRKLSPELQPIFKKMQGAYTKKMQEIAAVREQAEMVDRFRNDRDFAYQTVTQWAQQNGLTLAPVGAQYQQPTQQPKKVQAPPELVEVIKASLPEEMHWTAESQANAQWAAAQMLLQPLVKQQQESRQQDVQAQQQRMGQEWDSLAEELTGIAPGWEEHEPEMSELYDFIKSGQMRHQKFGSMHKLLYDLVTSNAASTAQVARRFTAAAKNRPSTGMTTGRTTSNLSDRIRQAKTSQDAFRLAAQAAEAGGKT